MEKQLPVVSFESKGDSKKYRDKKRKERKIKKEKGIKVAKIVKKEYNSDSEHEDDSDSDVEQEQPQPIKKTKPTPSTSVKVDDFSSKLGSILGQNNNKSKAAPILRKSSKLTDEQFKRQKDLKKANKEKQLENHLLTSKDYKPIETLLTPEERELSKIAKKGVIKLFNAVTQHQSTGLAASVDEKSKNVSKNQFLDTLKNSRVKSEHDDEDDDDEEGGQDFLNDDYLINNQDDE
ncbi:hypothetical protein CYY_001276 [Polysphondylium violaceum]|uniref:Rrp15p-domain-containing protein n=1 Tax=Polysphondylium violaceum TaxID=133409 RepID=A0A8J4Q3E6_9MYCE|nr:hypothetical protein CYY_001276 [Polysphondylium violaceum]